MTDLVQIHQYPVPEEQAQRKEFAVRMIWAGLIVLAIFVSATIFVGVTASMIDVWAMLGLTVVPALAICVFGFYWHRKHATFSYEVAGVRVHFAGPEYYVPQDKMESLVLSVQYAWEDQFETNPREFYDGVLLTVVNDKPIFPLDGNEVIGLTYNDRRHSKIWGPYALSRGGAAYELLLHGAEHMWPRTSEGVQIERMKRYGVFSRLKDAFHKHGLE